MDYDDVMPEGDGFSETSDQPKWRRAKLQAKVNRKLKRLRMNQRLRKTLMPKNAIMVLNEMKAGVQFTFPETQSIPNSLFLVHAELDGKTYVGQGLSKPLARQNAAENALKCLLLEKMTAAANKARTDAENDSQGAVESADTTKEGVSAEGVAAAAVAAAEGGQAQESTATPMSVDETDEIPWSSLASFALYKLFLEWQNQGTVVPIPRPGTQTPPKIRAESKPPTERVLPENALSVHPVMLLNQMKPGITYVEVSRSGNPPHTMFTLSVEIDEKVFTGSAKNKRDAKKIAAKAALKALYNLEYPEEIKPEPVEPMQVTEAMLQQPLQ
ncbi:double-stranded RNA-specific editase 1 isoform X2 [Fopius arisanus]|uniref:Double-stranded RNA-specific editase 1 isoform X2 n=1 Tax=Fopius arisanus TaxID=64838 RepID=A0A9R1TH92_9HYME|nr:PREDICTED: double-stranded RNA-specific editase 1 isoform X2 [Fopius arisanus]